MPRTRPCPPDFLWGTAISAHQSEGNNTASDCWLAEHVSPTLFAEPSGDGCDSLNRFREDIALAAGLGFNCHRFGIEWARIEPEPGCFSQAALDHYARVLDACRDHGLAPIVTLNHFTVPRWFAMRGGFEEAENADLFARYVDRVARALGDRMHAATTFNEANIGLLLPFLPNRQESRPLIDGMIAACAKASGSDRFATVLFGDQARIQSVLVDSHEKGTAAIKAACPDLPVGVTLTMQDVQGVGEGHLADWAIEQLYGPWLDVARRADFVGVQTYTRVRIGAQGPLPPPDGAETTAAGYEYYPSAIGGTIRFAHERMGRPIWVTENGMATDDDARRIAYIDEALDAVRGCIEDGIPVHSYIHWSLLDNFEWVHGYGQRFGLVTVDRTTFQRTPKSSAHHLGAIAKANML
jgi:beta-glucosidase